VRALMCYSESRRQTQARPLVRRTGQESKLTCMYSQTHIYTHTPTHTHTHTSPETHIYTHTHTHPHTHTQTHTHTHTAVSEHSLEMRGNQRDEEKRDRSQTQRLFESTSC